MRQEVVGSSDLRLRRSLAMSEEKKGFWSKLKGSKKSAGCCSPTIGGIPEDAPEEAEAKETAKKAAPAPCCGGAPTPRRGGRGGSCCG